MPSNNTEFEAHYNCNIKVHQPLKVSKGFILLIVLFIYDKNDSKIYHSTKGLYVCTLSCEQIYVIQTSIY